MKDFISYFALALGALLPVVNPIGSSLVFLGMVGPAPTGVFRTLARKIALSTAIFLLAMDVAGTAVLKLFGISLPVMQLAGGIVLASMGWQLLNKKDVPDQPSSSPLSSNLDRLNGKIFYPFTFPVTAGPGVLVVMLTLSAHASKGGFLQIAFAQLGVLAGMALMCAAVFFFYAYAPAITAKVPQSTAHGILRVIAFILFCIGVQIAWNGLSALLATQGLFKS